MQDPAMTAAPPAPAAPPSMPRASAKAPTRKAASSARSCATAIARTGITVIGPNCMGVACGAREFLHRPRRVAAAAGAEPGRNRRAERRDGDLDQPRHQRSRAEDRLPRLLRQPDRLHDRRLHRLLRHRPELRVILCYIEGVPDAAHFLEAARRARANGKTVVAVKVGALGDLARRGAGAYRLARRQRGGVRRRRRQRRRRSASARSRTRSRRSSSSPASRCRAASNIAVMTNSGALRSLITEAAERTGATLATLSDATAASLGAILAQPRSPTRSTPSAPFRSSNTPPASTRWSMRPRSTSCWPRRTCRSTTAWSGGSATPVDRRHRAARRKPGQDRRGVHAAAGEPDRLRPRRCASADPARADAARHRARAAHRRCAGARRRPPDPCRAVHRAARGYRTRPALARPRRRARSARPRSTRSNPRRCCGAYGIAAAAGAARQTADEAVAAAQADRLSGGAQGGVGGAAAQERRRSGAAQPRTTPTPCGKPPPRSPAAPAPCPRRSTVCWSRSRSRAEPRSCSACSATSRWARS